MQHIHLARLYQYPSGKTEADRPIEEHLASCAECQGRLMQVQRFLESAVNCIAPESREGGHDRGLDCPDDQLVGNYVEDVLLHRGEGALPEADRQQVEEHLEACDVCLNLVVNTYKVLHDIDWNTSLAQTEPKTVTQPGSRTTWAPLFIALVARVIQYRAIGGLRSQQEQLPEENMWELVTEEGNMNIALPAHIAQHCYSKPKQQVTLRLRRAPVADRQFEPQIVVSPPPTQNPLELDVSFANGETRHLTIPVPRRKSRGEAWSRACQPLSADAFGTEEWDVWLEYELEDLPT